MHEGPNLREILLNDNYEEDLESSRRGFLDRESLPTGEVQDCLQTIISPKAPPWSTLSNFGFLWVDPVLRKALSRGKLDLEDLPQVPSGLNVASCDTKARKVWERTRDHSSALKLMSRMISIHRSSLAVLLCLRVFGDILNLLGPVLLARLLVSFHVTSFNLSMSSLRWVSQSKLPFLGNKIFNSGIFLSSFVLKSIVESQLTYKRGILKNSIQSGLITLVFSENLRCRLQSSSGKVQNLISIDTDRASNILISWIDIGSMVFQLIGSLILLYVNMRWTCLVGILLVLVMIPVNHFISSTIKNCSVHMMSAKDERASLLLDFMTSIRTVKASHWEPYFTRKISKVRAEEIHSLTIIKMFDAVCVCLWAMTSLLMSAGTFGVWSFTGQTLTPQIVYPTISLFNIILVPINALPWVINGLVESYVSLVRLNDFFEDLRMEQSAQGPLLSERTQLLQLDDENQSKLIRINEAEFSHPPGAAEGGSFRLKVDRLFVGETEDSSQNLVTINGGIGSGKTSFLLSLLNEMVKTNGHTINNHERISFAPQEPFLMVGSIKMNILFGHAYDRERYRKIVFACGLDEDFKSLKNGDEFEIHDLSDLCLSGGQRARIMLARALYPKDSTLILVDDLLGCLDSRLSSHIVKYAFSGEITGGKTVFVVTNHPELTSISSSILNIENGFVVEQQGLKTQINAPEEINIDIIESQISEERKMYNGIVLEEREQGSVSTYAYRYYLCKQKYWLVILLLSLTLMQSSRNYADFWLAEHIGPASRYDTNQDVEQFIKVYFLIVAACGIFTLVRSFSFALGGLKSAVKIHDDLLQTIIQWEFSKFLSLSSGQILNRLINDINIIDDALPFILNIFLAQVFGLGGIIIVLVISQRANAMLMLPVILLLAWWFLRIQRVYVAGARDIKRIESIYRAPLLSMFQSSGEGCLVIRSFRKEAYFEGHLKHQVELYMKILHASVGLSAWLSLRLQLMSSLIATMIVGFGFFGDNMEHSYFNGYQVSTGLLGLSLSYILSILQFLGGLTTSASEVEREMVSVERVMKYLTSDHAENVNSHKSEVELEGDIICHHVSFKYEISWALNDICLIAPAAKRLAICGRSGSGKSTLMGCIMGLLPVHSGDIFFGGISITQVSVSSLRRSIGYLPQNPIVFATSIRENLDPDAKFDDSTLLSCLRMTGFLQRYLKKLPTETIDEEILDCRPKGLSSAEKSTLSLSRLLLHKPPYLILDEPSSMLNEDDIMELLGVLDTEFKSATIIESVHKLIRASSADLVAILSNGMIQEMGPPNDLQRNQDSEFNRMLEGVHQKRV